MSKKSKKQKRVLLQANAETETVKENKLSKPKNKETLDKNLQRERTAAAAENRIDRHRMKNKIDKNSVSESYSIDFSNKTVWN